MPKRTFDFIKYKKAIDFSFNFYGSKLRKGMKYPYFSYLSSVSNMIIENNGSTEEAIAGLFHDILEEKDGPKKSNTIKLKFGVKVFNIVKQCSNQQPYDQNESSWEERKKQFIDNMGKKSQSSLLVSICDKIHSLNCIINDHNKIGKKLWHNNFLEPQDYYWYYRSLCTNFKKFLKNHKTLKDKFHRNVNELGHLLKN